MRKRQQVLWSALLIGTTASVITFSNLSRLPLIGQWFQPESPPPLEVSTDSPSSAIAPWIERPATERADFLKSLIDSPNSADRLRARYLLATDLIQQDHGGQALPLLEDLEKDYPVLGAQILAKRAQAQTATGNNGDAEKTWKHLLKRYPKSPMAAEALYALGRNDDKYWDQVLAEFSGHPRALEIAQFRLEKNPKQPQLLLLQAKYGVHLDNITAILARIKKEYSTQLTPENWQDLGFTYWENAYYGSAGEAYSKAPPSAFNLYRAARGAQLGERFDDAEQGYRALIQAFPKEKETGMALLKLADLADKPEEAISNLDQVIGRFPEQAPEALLAKSKLMQKKNSPEQALKLRQTVLEQYSQSDTAAEIRWQQAELLDQQGDLNGAWSWAKQVVEQNPDSEIAPKAGFWIGKWAAQLKQLPQAQEAYKYVLSRYPDSYYAWRSASLLGWDVGDFTTVREKLPAVAKPPTRSTLTAGSEALKELHQLGQTQDAWAMWQVEFTNRLKPTVSEQFTDGIMRLSVNDNLDGIFMLSSLVWRTPPDEKADYKTLRKQASYWQALYPFPFVEIIEPWAQKRSLNPMLVTGLIRQESRFEPKIESSAGAKGLMQVMPETADWIASQIKLKQYDLTNPDDNVNLGTWYLDFTHKEYANNSVFAVASYNAGPAKVGEWIQKYDTDDIDRFVEKIPYPETRGYVEFVLGNYWNYLRIYNPDISQQLAGISAEQAAIVGK
jgi:soluble lytic murein transglycosylase